MKKNLILIIVSLLAIGCSGNGSGSNNNSEPNNIQIRHEAYDKGFRDGKAHSRFDSSNGYSGSKNAAYLIGYKEGYNAGQSDY